MTDPAAGPPELDEARRARITARVDAVLATDDGLGPSRRGLLVLRVAVVLLVVAAASLAGWAAGQRGSTGRTEPLGLARLAAEAGAARPAPLGDRWAHLTLAQQGAEATRWTDEVWLAADGTGRRVHTVLDAAGRPGEAETEVADRPGILTMGGLTPGEVASLGGDPERVLARLRAGTGVDGPPESLIVSVVELLAWPGVPPETRAALFLLLDDLGYRARPGTASGTAVLSGPGPNAEDATSITIDLITTASLGYVSRDLTGRLDDRSTTFLDAHLATTPG